MHNIEQIEVFYFVAGLILSGFFSGTEAVLMSIPVERIQQIIESSKSKAKVLKFMVSMPTELLTTILVGNNIVNIFVAAHATSIASRVFQNNAVALSVGITTAFVLIFGEIMPKTFARTHAEKLVYPCVWILRAIYFVLWPITFTVSFVIQKVLGKNAQLNGRVITQDDIEFMVNQAEKEKTIDSKQLDMLNSILEFPKIKVRDVMIPRNKINGIEVSAKYAEIIALVQNVAHSRYPVYEEDLDNVMGFLHVKDLVFLDAHEREKFNIMNFVKEPFYVFEHMKIQSVFDHMNKKKVHLALVKDENSVVVGMISLEDIIEEIFGEIQDEHDTEDDGIPRVDEPYKNAGELIVPGIISLRDLMSEHDIKIPPNDNYSTLNGFILDMLEDNFPKRGQVIIWENYSFELSKVNDLDIIEVTIRNLRDKTAFHEIDQTKTKLDGHSETTDQQGLMLSRKNEI